MELRDTVQQLFDMTTKKELWRSSERVLRAELISKLQLGKRGPCAQNLIDSQVSEGQSDVHPRDMKSRGYWLQHELLFQTIANCRSGAPCGGGHGHWSRRLLGHSQVLSGVAGTGRSLSFVVNTQF